MTHNWRKSQNRLNQNKVLNSNQLNILIESIYKKGEQTLLLTIINNNNQRRPPMKRVDNFNNFGSGHPLGSMKSQSTRTNKVVMKWAGDENFEVKTDGKTDVKSNYLDDAIDSVKVPG